VWVLYGCWIGCSRRAGGTLPVTARSLETIIRLSSAHAKLKLHPAGGRSLPVRAILL